MSEGGINPETQGKQLPNPERQRVIGRVIKALVFAGLALTACSQSEKNDVQSKVLEALSTPNPPAETLNFDESGEFSNEGLNTTTIEAGDSIVSAIDKFHGVEGTYNTYANLGLVVTRNGEPVIYFENKLGIDYSSVLGNLVTVQPGDEISWGATGDVTRNVRNAGFDESVMQVSGARLDCSQETGACMDQLTAMGGAFEQPITFFYQEGGQMSDWKANVGASTLTVDQAIAAAQIPAN